MAEHSNKKKIILTICVLGIIAAATTAAVMILLGMQQRSHREDYRLSADEVVTGVIKKMKYSGMSPISKENISRYYEIPKDAVTDYAMYVSGRSGTEIEIACFKLKNSSDEKAVTEAVNQYLSGKSMTTPPSSGSATQTSNVPQVFHYNVTVHDPYVFVAVAQDSETAVNAFEAVLSESLKRTDAAKSAA